MNVKFDRLLGKVREDTEGFTGVLNDSTNTAIADVSRGLITGVYFTGTARFLLMQDGTSKMLAQNGSDYILKQGA